MKESFANFSTQAIFLLTSLIVAVAILFFLPTTSEFFEFNKLTVVLTFTITVLLLWSARMVLQKRVVLTRTPLDIPLIILVVVFLASSLASIDTNIAFFGKHGRVWPSFFALLTLAALYFALTSNLKTKKQTHIILLVITIATVSSSLISLASYFGAFLPFDFAQVRSFNTLGIINRLALLQALIIPAIAYLAIFEREKFVRTVATITTLLISLSFILINFVPAYIGLTAALAFLFAGTLRTKLSQNQKVTAITLAVLAAIFLIVRFVPQIAHGTLYEWIAIKDAGASEAQQIDTPKEKSPSTKAAWEIAFSAIGKRPTLGTGPGTYQFVYTQLKPRYVNSTEDWGIRFESSSSEFAEIITTTGIVGTLAFLYFALVTLRFAWTLVFKSQNFQAYLPFASAVVGFIVASFFTTFSLATATIFFILLALLTITAKSNDERHVFDVTVELAALKNRVAWFPLGVQSQPVARGEVPSIGSKSQILPWLFTVVVLIAAIWAIWQQFNIYRGEYFYRQALLASRSGDGNKTVTMLQRALSANARVDTYHRLLSQTSLNAALNLSRQENLDENEQRLLSQLAQVAIDQGKAASGYQILPLRLPGISAANVANWESLSNVYQTLIGAVGGADVHATNTLTQAVSLDPQNPILHNRLGQLYERLGNLDLAQRKYEDAIIVKNDFGPAHYFLANLLIQRQGDVKRIVDELTIAKRILPEDDPARADIDEKLEKYNEELRKIQEQQAQVAQPVQPEASPTTSPEPSPTASPEPSPSPSPTTSPSPSPSF